MVGCHYTSTPASTRIVALYPGVFRDLRLHFPMPCLWGGKIIISAVLALERVA